ncbi:MAG: DUF2591 domain-containing protein [Pseudomonas sp.]|nr:DUF2591 domain-containing protein [Pseudomonas sp.]
MNQVEVKTAELIGPALDWVVLVAEGWESDRPQDGQLRRKISATQYDVCIVGPRQMGYDQHLGRYWRSPSTDWNQGGPLIERLAGFQLKIWLESSPGTKCEAAIHDYKGDWIVFGPTPLIAAMRCLVAAKLGDTVQIPSELIQ